MKRQFRISTRNRWRNSQILTQTRKRFKNNLMTCRWVAIWRLSLRFFYTRWVIKSSETLTLMFQTIIYDFPNFCSVQNMWYSLLYFKLEPTFSTQLIKQHGHFQTLFPVQQTSAYWRYTESCTQLKTKRTWAQYPGVGTAHTHSVCSSLRENSLPGSLTH